MVEFEYTPMVASETAGLGFSLPLPQRQVGVDVRNANPNTRAAMAQSMPFYEVSEDIDPTLTNLRDAYIADVQGLNALVQEAVALGYDPRTIDYQDPQSIEINKMYREMLNPIKQKEAQLRYAKPITERMRVQGEIYDPLIMDVANLSGFGGAQDIAKAASQSISSYGYDDAGLKAAEQVRADAIANIDAIYAPYVQRFAGNESMLESLETMHQRDLNSIKTALPRAQSKQRDPLTESIIRDETLNARKLQREVESYLKRTTPQEFGNDLVNGENNSNVGKRVTVKFGGTVTPATTTAIFPVDFDVEEYTSDGYKISNGVGVAADQKYDEMAVVLVSKDGRVVEDVRKFPSNQIAGFKVLAKGSGKTPNGKVINVYNEFENVAQFKDEAQATALLQRRSELQELADKKNAEWRSGKKASDKKAKTTNTKTKSFKGVPEGGKFDGK